MVAISACLYSSENVPTTGTAILSTRLDFIARAIEPTTGTSFIRDNLLVLVFFFSFVCSVCPFDGTDDTFPPDKKREKTTAFFASSLSSSSSSLSFFFLLSLKNKFPTNESDDLFFFKPPSSSCTSFFIFIFFVFFFFEKRRSNDDDIEKSSSFSSSFFAFPSAEKMKTAPVPLPLLPPPRTTAKRILPPFPPPRTPPREEGCGEKSCASAARSDQRIWDVWCVDKAEKNLWRKEE